MTHTPLRPAHSPGAEAGTESDTRVSSRRPRWPWIAGGVVAVVAAAGAGTYALAGGGEGTEPAKKADSGTTALAATGSEGTLAFTATRMECGVAAVGPEELPQRATGEFCLVDVTVRNTGTEAALLDPGAQRAVDGQGREHAVADQAGVFLNDRAPSLLDEIAPGATVSGVLAFDVPAGERLTALVLRESMDSTGVRLPLS